MRTGFGLKVYCLVKPKEIVFYFVKRKSSFIKLIIGKRKFLSGATKFCRA